jgi:cytochrome c5
MPAQFLLLLVMCVVIAACGQGNSGKSAPSQTAQLAIVPTRAQIAYAAAAIPPTAELSAIYERSCKACHALINTGAPLTGHSAAWRPRFEAKGAAGLLASTIGGVNSMPTKGMCPDCSEDQFRALIAFMMTEGS